MSLREQTGTGLVDDFTFHIKDARFFHDARFQDGEVALLELTGINSVTGSEDRIWLKCGRTFEAADNGKRLHYTGNAKTPKINKASQYGIWIDSFVSCEGTDELVDKMDAFVADSWIGLSVDVHRGTRSYNIEGTTYEGQVFEVTAVNNVDRSEPADTTPDTTPDIPPAILNMLNNIARESNTFEQFVDTAYEEIPELLNAEWETWVTSEDGFWATTNQ